MSNNIGTEVEKRVEYEYPCMFSRIFILKPVATNRLAFAMFDLRDSMLVQPDDVLPLMFVTCQVCGEFTSVVSDMTVMRTDIGSIFVCDHCKKHYIRECVCGRNFVYDSPHPENETRHVAMRMSDGTDKIVCGECSLNVARCEKCGQIVGSGQILTADIEGEGDIELCRTCYDKLLTTHKMCHVCGMFVRIGTRISVPSDPARTHCSECAKRELAAYYANSRPTKEVGSYDHNRGGVFMSTEGGISRFFGLEIEAENGKSAQSQSADYLREAYDWPEFDLKEDGSIDGVESVSRPVSLDYIQNHLRLHEWCTMMKKYGFAGDTSNNAGMHIHISRAAFGDSHRKQQRAIAAFLFLFQRKEFREQIKTFSRRRGAFHYCEFYDTFRAHEDIRSGAIRWRGGFDTRLATRTGVTYHENTTIARELQKAMMINKHYRNRIVNFHIYSDGEMIPSPHTVEVRLFKSSLNPESIYAAVELVDLFADIAISEWTDESLRALTWKDICRKSQCSKYIGLSAYLKRRKIWEE